MPDLYWTQGVKVAAMTDADLKQQKLLERIAKNNGITVEEAALLNGGTDVEGLDDYVELPPSPTTYAEAMEQGQQYMELARVAASKLELRALYSRLNRTTNYWEEVLYLQTRAAACFQLAALLKP